MSILTAVLDTIFVPNKKRRLAKQAIQTTIKKVEERKRIIDDSTIILDEHTKLINQYNAKLNGERDWMNKESLNP